MKSSFRREAETVLVIEDDADHAFLVKHALLRAAGFLSVRVFSSGKDALKWLEKAEIVPAFCLLDFHMPGMNAVAFLEHLWKKNLPRFPVLLLSASTTEEELQQAYEAGVAGYLAKPLGTPENLQRLQNYLDLLQIPLRVWPYANVPSQSCVVV